VHFDALDRIFHTPAAPDAEIEDGAQITEKSIVNARTHPLQLVLDFRRGYFARESIM
jgi:hypothetical protein